MALCLQIQLSTIQLRSPGFLWRVVINLGSGFIQGVKDSKWSEKKQSDLDFYIRLGT